MKRLKMLLAFLLVAGSMLAQKTVEVVYLKNGGLVRGEIIEQIPGQSLKIQTKDGNIFVYKMDEVERITKEAPPAKASAAPTKGHRGLDFNIDVGYNLPTKDGADGTPSAELSIGKRSSGSFYWGLGAGAYIPTSGGDVQIPITAEFKPMFPLSTTNITPFVSLKGGYILNTAGDVKISSGGYGNNQTIKKSDFVLLQLTGGVQIPLSNKVDFNLAAGYAHMIAAGGDMDGGGMVVIRAGFGFHKSLIKNVKPPKAPQPIRDKGMQMTLEGNIAGHNGGLGLVLGYKLTPNLFVGLGYNYNKFMDMITELNEHEDRGEAIYYDQPKGSENRQELGRGSTWMEYKGKEMHQIFVRGQYRLLDKRFSPVAALDLGYRIANIDLKGNSLFDYKDKACDDKSSLFAKPSVGMSLRIRSNSYIDLRVGYAFNGKMAVDGSVETRYERKTAYADYRSDGVDLSGPFLSLGWTHTFGKSK